MSAAAAATPALNQLRNFDWPGNLPQLSNVVRTLAVTTLSNEIDATDVNRVLTADETAGACRCARHSAGHAAARGA